MSCRNSVLKSMALTDPSLEFKSHGKLFPKCSSCWVTWKRTCRRNPLQAESLDVVVSTEVVEHLYHPQRLIQNAFRLLKPSGHFIVSTPYHGYVKNVVLALSGKLDNHFTALWDGGHIKFWSHETLSELLTGKGLQIYDSLVQDVCRVFGRV
jgi:2-polyprenyl-3-methyl-5-hydroxy-6-metoxy-1,4-benzoquinol methylase